MIASSSRKTTSFPLESHPLSLEERFTIFFGGHRRLALVLSWVYQLVLWLGLALVGIQLGNRVAQSETIWQPFSGIGGMVDIGLRHPLH